MLVFLSSLFVVLYASCSFIGVFFFRLENFSSIIFLNIFSGPLSCNSSPSSTPVILRFCHFMVSQISSMFCVKNLLDLLCSLIDEFISSIVSSVSEILSSISCILLVILVSVVPVHFPRFSIPSNPLVCIFFLASISVFKS